MSDQIQYAEKVIERAANGCVTRSELVPIKDAGEECRNPCGHIGIKSEDCWPYTIVKCAVCGEGLGVS